MHFLSFQRGPGRVAPAKKSGKKKGCSAINGVVTREYTINIHMPIHRVGFKKCAPWALGDPESCQEGDGKSRCVY